jgi:hypothetical protein
MAANEVWQRIKMARDALDEMSATMTKESQDKFIKEIQDLRKFSNNLSPSINKDSLENQIQSMISEGYTILKQESNSKKDLIMQIEGKNKDRVKSLRAKSKVKYNETKRRNRGVKDDSDKSNFLNEPAASSVAPAAAASAAPPLLPKSRFPNILNDITNINNNIDVIVDKAKEEHVGDGDFFEFFKYNKSKINKYDFYFFRKSSSYVKLPPLPQISEEYQDENISMLYDELLLVYNKISNLQNEYDTTSGPKRLVKEKIEIMRENYGFPILFKLTYYTLKFFARKIEELSNTNKAIPVDLADKYQYVYWALWRRNKRSGLSNQYFITKDEIDYFNKIRGIAEKVHPIFGINPNNISGNNNNSNNFNNNNSGNNGNNGNNNNSGNNANNNNSGNNYHNSNNTYSTSNNRKGKSRKNPKKAESKYSVSTRKSSIKEYNNNNLNEANLPKMLSPENIAKNKNKFVGNAPMSFKNLVNSTKNNINNINNSALRIKGLTQSEMLKHKGNEESASSSTNNNVVLPLRRVQVNAASASSSTNNNNNVVLPSRRVQVNAASASSSTNNNNIVAPRRVVELAEYGNTTETETDQSYMAKRKRNNNKNLGRSLKKPRPNNKTRRTRKY